MQQKRTDGWIKRNRIYYCDLMNARQAFNTDEKTDYSVIMAISVHTYLHPAEV